MKSKSAKKAADEDEAKSKKIRSSRGKRRSVRHSRSRSPSPDGSSSSSPPRKRSKKPTKKIVDKRSKKSKGSGSRRGRRRSLSPSRSPSGSPSSVSRSHPRRSHHSISSSSASDSERSVSPLPKSHSKDPRKKKGRGRDKDRKRRRLRRSRSYSSSPARSGSSRSRSRSRSKSKSRKRRADGMRHDASRDRVVQDYDNCQDPQNEKRSVEDVYSDEDAVADDYEKNVELKEMESPPSKDAHEPGEILPVNCESPEVEEDLELILRQKALENFRKFKGAMAMVGKTENNGTGKEVLTDSPQNTVTKFPEARSAVAPFQRQGSNLGVGHSTRSPEFEDFENGRSPWKQETTHRDISPGILEAGDTCGPTQQLGSGLEEIRSTSHITSHDGRNGGSVMQRLGSTPASSGIIKQRLGISSVVSPVQARPRVRSVVSIPSREGLDDSTFTTIPTACENPASVESSSEVRHFPAEINKLEGIDGDDRKIGEASVPESSVLSTDAGKSQAAGTEDKDASQFEKRTFSRMHDGETVQVSYKVYIPATSPRLARRKLQR
ncbi:splicing regulatory glutamine/lysine-rich protein 1-like [Triticum urartu]|uniref:splicing regulatory glutamine/lysine-rich protein 1-like n=1 Tax=Triticum urartu TaxID=4572 RepID=UPI0020433B95|nr:splicing regulatory glutamine/lysine-rich protein 1-like [Triticum urartu]XP_048556930.1 splicing regulatory glutamine/lysine-rich protein 1-like [Triticum urartu]